MRRRRNGFARETLVPVRAPECLCAWCGAADPKRPAPDAATCDRCAPGLRDRWGRCDEHAGRGTRRIYRVVVERDSGRDSSLAGAYCSWGCVDAYLATGARFAR